ncbi:MAG: SDR family NAD(P)-dependent oxidoreductase [Rectinemataceae bacterium]
MSDIDHVLAAPLVRGLFLNELDLPAILVPGAEPASSKDEALEVSFAAAGPGGLDEPASAAALAASLEAWRSAKAGRSGLLPACVTVSIGAARSSYYAAAGVDEARRRAEKRDASPWPAPKSGKSANGGSAEKRSRVVEGRVALVTGGAQGFGEEIVRGLAASGALVFVADLNFEGARRLADSLCAEAARTVAIPVSVNVTDEASVAAMMREAAAAAGGIDLVVSNAGVLKAASVLEQNAADFRFVTDVNYTGFFHVAKHAGLVLRRQRRSAPRWRTDLIQINSKSGLEGSNRNGAYAGSKFGGVGLVQSYALELVEYGIKVNAICPGNFFDGPLWSDPAKGLFVQYLRSGKVPDASTVADVKAYYEAKVPMGRGCEGPDVMRAIYYLVEQEYETGQALPVTGGQVMLN